ncbi:hypothetical protein [Shewanella halifaxensis]|uniref:hypothetical protein n=1 Tax=Shewanella halifaxensis TaxID=271098 RepID=UPI001232B64B|nr:hypothetical protein [Shewanella halifaxensis]
MDSIFVHICGGFIGLSPVTTVLVDEMVRDNHDELEQKVDLLSELNEQQAKLTQSIMVEKMKATLT